MQFSDQMKEAIRVEMEQCEKRKEEIKTEQYNLNLTLKRLLTEKEHVDAKLIQLKELTNERKRVIKEAVEPQGEQLSPEEIERRRLKTRAATEARMKKYNEKKQQEAVAVQTEEA